MALGISYRNVDKNSFLSIVRDDLFHPLAASTTFFVNAQTLNGLVVGTALTLTANAAAPMIYGRRPSITTFDNASSDLTCTVRVVGRRWGKQITQDIAATAGGTGATFTGTRILDEIVSATVVAVANNGASDTISVGFDDSWLGLVYPIRLKSDIRMVWRDVNGTPDNLPKFNSDLTAAMLNLKDSAIDVKTLYSAAIAATHSYTIEYEAGGAGIENFDRKGLRFKT
jgi:hypothetical protein